MGSERLLRLRLPRVVVGTVGRSSSPERVAVWDEVPVRVREATYREAPLVVGGMVRDVHAIDGRLYMLASESPKGPEQAWNQLASRAFADILKAMRERARPGERHDARIFPWAEGLADASRRRGLGPSAEVCFRSVEDDGLAEQARKAARLAGRLAFVGNRLYALASTPRYQVGIGYRNPTLSFRAGILPWRHEAAADEPWGPFDFPLGRRASAIAFMDRLGDPGMGYGEQNLYRTDHKIHRPDAYEACLPAGRDADIDALRGIASGVIEALRPHLGALPLAHVERWAALARLSERGDVPGMRAWLDAARPVREALAASGAVKAPEHGEPDNPLVRIDACIVRYEEVERPRMHLDRDGDEAALLGL